jgi:hypothetical protein
MSVCWSVMTLLYINNGSLGNLLSYFQILLRHWNFDSSCTAWTVALWNDITTFWGVFAKTVKACVSFVISVLHETAWLPRMDFYDSFTMWTKDDATVSQFKTYSDCLLYTLKVKILCLMCISSSICFTSMIWSEVSLVLSQNLLRHSWGHIVFTYI